MSRYDDVVAVLHDTATFSSAVVPQVPARDRAGLAGFVDWSARSLFFLDPPEHAGRRGPVATSGRAPNPHLAFGLGPHYCPGAALTRLTARAALGALLDAYGTTLSIAETALSWRDHDPIVRGLTGLPVRATGAPGPDKGHAT